MTAPLQIHIGDTYKKWTALEVLPYRSRWGEQLVVCQCACGTRRVLTAKSLVSRKSQGCLKCKNPSRTRHGHMRVGHETPTYRSWRAMRDRCENPRSPSWPWYGGQGITVCHEWQKFEQFLADMGERPDQDYTIERKDNTLGYSAANCVWIPRREQNLHTSANHLMTFQGRILPLALWSEITGINAGTIRSRLRYGWTDEQALATPVQRQRPYYRVTPTLESALKTV